MLTQVVRVLDCVDLPERGVIAVVFEDERGAVLTEMFPAMFGGEGEYLEFDYFTASEDKCKLWEQVQLFEARDMALREDVLEYRMSQWEE